MHSYFIYKPTNIVRCNVIHILYQGIMYFKNVILCYCTRVNVIFYDSNKSTSFPALIITKLRMFNNIVYSKVPKVVGLQGDVLGEIWQHCRVR